MCCICTKVLQDKKKREEDKSWNFEPHDYDYDYSHGFCPPCHKNELSKVDDYMRNRNG